MTEGLGSASFSLAFFRCDKENFEARERINGRTANHL
jgi:hypothetical protein